jgi:hypothetical protein
MAWQGAVEAWLGVIRSGKVPAGLDQVWYGET